MDEFHSLERYPEGVSGEDKAKARELAEKMGAVASYLGDATFVSSVSALCVAYRASAPDTLRECLLIAGWHSQRPYIHRQKRPPNRHERGRIGHRRRCARSACAAGGAALGRALGGAGGSGATLALGAGGGGGSGGTWTCSGAGGGETRLLFSKRLLWTAACSK
eukprot:COSAG06_NODE_3606_length_5130_cov_11.552878_3_plen_164_part_00